MDFVKVANRLTRNGMEIYPKFIVKSSKDLMIRGGDFYAIWDDEAGLWSTSRERAIELIDREIELYAKDYAINKPKIMYLWDSENGYIDKWNKYCKQQMWDNYVELDNKLIFASDPVCKDDYASKRLTYSLDDIATPAYDELMGTLYSDDERMKIEWAIGSIIAGESSTLQKFLVLYGDKGTGKSTVLNIIQQLFDGYFGTFDSKALGSGRDFALESLKENPLVAIQHDGDMSRIEDNTIINSLVSHEIMVVNEKYKSTYSMRFKSFLFMGTNKPVRITDSKSGILRRLIDVSPTGNKVSIFKYKQLIKDIKFELGGIANHCLQVYNANKNIYDNYVPLSMLGASNDFYNYIMDAFDFFIENDPLPLKLAWDSYKRYCDEARVPYPMSQRVFKEELKNYFIEFKSRAALPDGTRVRNLYCGFRSDAFETTEQKVVEPESKFIFKTQPSVFDDMCADCPAQYANDSGTPSTNWDNVITTLKDVDTRELHYVRVPNNHIVIDFDIPDETGEKSFKKNLEAANQFPLTYAELSKSGKGIHLHYLYSGDVSKLSSVYGEHIEVKVFNGKSSLRRKLSKCNDIPITTITGGLPLKKEKPKMIDRKTIEDQRHLENMIRQALNKEIKPFGQEPYTALCCQYINEVMQQAYDSGMSYDIRPMRHELLDFASRSHNSAQVCIKLMMDAKYCSKDVEQLKVFSEDYVKPVVFYDIEVFPNLLIVAYAKWDIFDKGRNVDKFSIDEVKVMINPDDEEISKFMTSYLLIGFNNRRYDNHVIYARSLGYSNAQCYDISKKIIAGDKNATFWQAYGLSYTDIYEFMSNKKSLKALEIDMGINHLELGEDWNQPVPEEKWQKVADYCKYDVYSTIHGFEYLINDWEARKILAKISGGNLNMSTNQLSTLFMFGDDPDPQKEFRYRNLAEPVLELTSDEFLFLSEIKPDMLNGRDICDQESLMPYFPGYTFDSGKSMYKGISVGNGGWVYANHNIHLNVALLDVSSMHPNSVVDEILFGPKYTRRFNDVLEARLMVKHKEYDKLRKHMGGVFNEVVDDLEAGIINSKALALALKIIINSIYGMTCATYPNVFKDPRNVDNIVAKRGALFMVDLKEEVEKRGFTVAHIKTDSIKIPNATPEIIQFVMDFGKLYGYNFEHEATYEKMCLVNDSTYIAKYASAEKCMELYGYVPGDNEEKEGKWEAVGKQFQVPYVYKQLFDRSSAITLKDMAETKMSHKSALYLDFNEGLSEGEHNYQFIGKIGQFTPVKDGAGGGILVVKKENADGTVKYDSAPDSKGYRWKETLTVNNLEDVNREFYMDKVNEAIDAISEYGDYMEFMEGE